jgi:hypothetical protein
VPEGVTRHTFVDRSAFGGVADGTLNDRFVQMMTTLFPLAVPPASCRREHPLPTPVASGGGQLARDGIGQPYLAPSTHHILFVYETGVHDLFV